MKKVMVFGTFDIVHEGHIHMLKEAKEYGDFLVVVVALDDTVCDVKGKRPLNNQEKRLNEIKKLGLADKVRLGCVGDKYKAVREENPDIIALGYDQRAFVDNLADAVDEKCQIVRLAPYMPEVYKSSKMKNN